MVTRHKLKIVDSPRISTNDSITTKFVKKVTRKDKQFLETVKSGFFMAFIRVFLFILWMLDLRTFCHFHIYCVISETRK